MAAGRYRRTDPCVIEGCPNLVNRTNLGICEAHYYRLRRHGSFGDTPVRPRSLGRAKCSIGGCENEMKAAGFCDLHYQRLRKHGDPAIALPKSQPGTVNPNWRGDAVTYSGAHQRVTRTRGPAAAHSCSMRGCERQAAQWSYLRTDGSPMPFSPDPADYRPLCVPCHKRYDLHALEQEAWAYPGP